MPEAVARLACDYFKVIGVLCMDLERIVNLANIETFTPLEAAERQLDRAIILLIVEHDYLCAITLACAAEGILGEFLHAQKKESMIEILKSELQSIDLCSHLSSKEISDQHLNKIRNILKHSSGDLGTKIDHVTDLEAFIAIVRAIANFILVTNRVSQRTDDFFDWVRQKRPEILEEAAKFELQHCSTKLSTA